MQHLSELVHFSTLNVTRIFYIDLSGHVCFLFTNPLHFAESGRQTLYTVPLNQAARSIGEFINNGGSVVGLRRRW